MSGCAECFGTKLHDLLLLLLPLEKRDFDFSDCYKMYIENQENKYKINTLHQYTQEEIEKYNEVYGQELDALYDHV